MRRLLMALALLGLAQGVWIIITETFASWPSLKADRSHLAAVASIVRGDLWAKAARASADFPPQPLGDWHPVDPERARLEARRALAFSPLRSDMWLLLAMLEPNLRPQDDAPDSLEMAFLTAGAATEDLPMRILTAARSPLLARQEVQDLLSVDITYILTRDAALIPALRRAHAQAPDTNRATLESIARAVDGSFAFAPAPGPP